MKKEKQERLETVNIVDVKGKGDIMERRRR
jgi:hypothetical protein